MNALYRICSSMLLLWFSTATFPTLAQTTRYVSTTGTNSTPASATSWATSTTNLQGAINASVAGDQVWVATGIYKRTTTTNRTISFAMKNGVAIYGSFAGTETNLTERTLTSPLNTTLSGDIGVVNNVADNSYHVISNPPGLTNSAILDGFVITGGKANGDFPNHLGGGMYNNGSGSGQVCSPLIRNCTFQGNTASSGGAMFNNGYLGTSNPSLTNCSFQGNTASNVGGAMYNYGYSGVSSPSLTNCVLFGNGGNKTFYNDLASVSARYSLFDASVTGYTGSPGNLTVTVSPFASTSSTQLNVCAPAIDAGLNSANTIPTDLAGLPRLVGTGTPAGTIDMGAYEFQTTPNFQTIITAQPATGSAVCVGGAVTASVSVSGTSPFTYQWYKGTTSLGAAQSGSALTLSNLTTTDTGSYSVVVTGACNSVTSTAFSLTVNPLPTGASLTDAGPTAGTLTCATTSLTLTANLTGGNAYTFSAGAVQIGSTNQAVVSSAGTYSVVVANASGCTATASTTVFSSTAVPTASINPNAVTLTCAATTVSLTASGGNTYRWDNNSTDAVNLVSEAGTYSVIVTATNGCTAIISVSVSGNTTPPTATLSGNATICSGSSTNLSVALTGTGPWSIAYTDGTTTTNVTATSSPFSISVSPASNTSYTLTAVSDGNCVGTVTGSAAVMVNRSPVLTVPVLGAVASEPNTCDAEVSFEATATGSPVPTTTYKIGETVITSPYRFTVGTTIVTATATNSCGSDSKTFAVTVTDNTAPLVPCLAEPVFHCFVANNTYSIPALVATDNCSIASVSFSITGATIRNGSGNNASGTFQPGTSTIQWTVTDASGNQSQCNRTVVINTPLSLTVPSVNPIGAGAQPNTIYTGYGPQSLTLLPIPSGGTAPYTYSWTNGATASSLPVSAAGSYGLIVTDANGCVVNSNVLIVKVVDVRCGNKNDKVAVCQKTSSDKNPWNQLCISDNAVAAHLANGSLLGQCVAAPGGRVATEAVSALTITLLPNPIEKGQMRAIVRGASGQLLTVELIGLKGQPVRQQAWERAASEQVVEWNIAAQPAGVYVLRAVSDGQNQTVKVLKTE